MEESDADEDKPLKSAKKAAKKEKKAAKKAAKKKKSKKRVSLNVPADKVDPEDEDDDEEEEEYEVRKSRVRLYFTELKLEKQGGVAIVQWEIRRSNVPFS